VYVRLSSGDDTLAGRYVHAPTEPQATLPLAATSSNGADAHVHRQPPRGPAHLRTRIDTSRLKPVTGLAQRQRFSTYLRRERKRCFDPCLTHALDEQALLCGFLRTFVWLVAH
jgi:hypothetical protein